MERDSEVVEGTTESSEALEEEEAVEVAGRGAGSALRTHCLLRFSSEEEEAESEEDEEEWTALLMLEADSGMGQKASNCLEVWMEEASISMEEEEDTEGVTMEGDRGEGREGVGRRLLRENSSSSEEEEESSEEEEGERGDEEEATSWATTCEGEAGRVGVAALRG